MQLFCKSGQRELTVVPMGCALRSFPKNPGNQMWNAMTCRMYMSCER